MHENSKNNILNLITNRSIVASFISAPSTRSRIRQNEGNTTTVQEKRQQNDLCCGKQVGGVKKKTRVGNWAW